MWREHEQPGLLLGFGHTGALGNGTTPMHRTLVPVAGELSFSEVSAGVSHTSGRTPASVAYCWGRHAYGRLGSGTLADHLTSVSFAGSDMSGVEEADTPGRVEGLPVGLETWRRGVSAS